MNLREAEQAYYDDEIRHTLEYNVWRDEQLARARGAIIDKPNVPFTGHQINISQHSENMVQALMGEFGFNKRQADFIFCFAYSTHHASFGDMYGQIKLLGEFAQQFIQFDK